MNSDKKSICCFLHTNKDLILLTVLAAAFFFYILNLLGSFEFINSSMFSTGDSNEYREYSVWIAGNADYCNPARTFFFPFLIMLSFKICGITGIWLMHFLMWLAACILIYLTVKKLTVNRWMPFVSMVLAATSVSLIVYCAHALTEITTFFLLSLLSFILAGYFKKMNKKWGFSAAVFVVALLASTKPLFLILFYFTVIITIFVYLKHRIFRLSIFLLLLAASSPVIIQKWINLTQHGTFSSTKIADLNYRDYFYRKVKFYAEDKTGSDYNFLPDSMHSQMFAAVEKTEKREITAYLISHPSSVIRVYSDNIEENFCSGNPYIDKKKNHSLRKWVENTNHNFIFILHLLMTAVWIFYMLKFIRKRPSEYFTVLFLGMLNFYILYTSGITYWAGDRLIVPAIALWSALYPLLVFLFFKKKNASVA
ncbi:MAG: hypothetical protein V2A54_11145 [Bacteroidota bacterium]